MDKTQIIAIQRRLGVSQDGILGPLTLAAIFAKFGATADRAKVLGKGAATALPRFGITANPLRFAHFLGQLAHESGGFRYMEEIASGTDYEGRKDLGNVKPGDGKRFKGRGPIQLTGRANYAIYGAALGLDLINHPEQVAQPEIGILVAALFWHRNGLNALADADDLKRITRKINGGYNGLVDRELKTLKAKALVL